MHPHDRPPTDRDGVEVIVLDGDDHVEEAMALLDAAEATLEAPLVDEAERERLHALAAGETERDAHWSSLLGRRGSEAVGYAAVLLPRSPGEDATGDVAIAPSDGPRHAVLAALLRGLESVAHGHAARLQVWMRHVGTADIEAAAAEGYTAERRLGVLGRGLEEQGLAATRAATDTAAGIQVRSYRPDEDDDAVVAVLAAAYAGTAEEGWDLARFRARRDWSWFRPEDLLVAEVQDGALGGLHWLKRRGEGVGEVYNLAIHPDAQGRGLGPVLLQAGLEHLRDVGCHDVVLWVDLANDRAVRLYTSQGFTTRWEDVALSRTLDDATQAGP
jgi:mycothiol synthase